MSSSGQFFRAGVGAVILNAEGQVLAFQRSDISGAWQLPQGGLEAGEEPEEAVYREMFEETGLRRDDLALIGRLPELTAYELPAALRSAKTGRGQVQYWFFFVLQRAAEAIEPQPGAEFSAWRWHDVGALVSRVAPFRAPVYERLRAHLKAKIMPQIRSRTVGGDSPDIHSL